MLSAASALVKATADVGEWDPLGLAPPPPPPRTGSAQAELQELKRAVCSFLDSASTMLPSSISESSNSLAAALSEVQQEWQEHVDTVQRELFTLRQTVSMLQSERRQQAPEPQPQPTPAEACIGPTEEVCRLQNALRAAENEFSAARGAAVVSTEAGVTGFTAPGAVGRQSGASSQPSLPLAQAAPWSADDRDTLAYAAELRQLREDAESLRAELSAARDQAATAAAQTAALQQSQLAKAKEQLEELEDSRAKLQAAHRASGVEAATFIATLSAALKDSEIELRNGADTTRKLLATTRRRAAQMLSAKDEAIARRDQQLAALGGAPGGDATTSDAVDAAVSSKSGAGAKDAPAGLAAIAVGTDVGAGCGDRLRSSGKSPASRSRASAAGGLSSLPEVLASSENTSLKSGTATAEVAEPNGHLQHAPVPFHPDAAIDDSASATAVGAETTRSLGAEHGSDEVGLASRFARRVAHLEAQVASAREQLKEAEALSNSRNKQSRDLLARLARQQRAMQRLRAGGADPEYMHNVMLKFLTLTSSERAPLLPVLGALFGFNEREMCAVQQACGEVVAPGAGLPTSWLLGGSLMSSAEDRQPSQPNSAASARSRSRDQAREAKPTVPAAQMEATRDAGRPHFQQHEAGSNSEVDALRAKVEKLRWLLSCANQEILKLKGNMPAQAAPHTAESHARSGFADAAQ